MANHISIDGSSSRLNGRLAALVAQTSQLQNEMSRVKIIMGECGATATPVDWVSVEAAFGLPTGTGTAVYALLSAAAARLNAVDVDNFCNRLG